MCCARGCGRPLHIPDISDALILSCAVRATFEPAIWFTLGHFNVENNTSCTANTAHTHTPGRMRMQGASYCEAHMV